MGLTVGEIKLIWIDQTGSKVPLCVIDWYIYQLISLTGVLCRPQKVFTYKTADSIMGGENRVLLVGKPTTIRQLLEDLLMQGGRDGQHELDLELTAHWREGLWSLS